MSSYQVYCASYDNEIRKSEMNHRFKTLDIDIKWIEAIGPDDIKLKGRIGNMRTEANMLSHIKCIEEFLKSDKDFGIICEDDIYIKKTFKDDILTVMKDMKRLDLKLILLGYLIDFIPLHITLINHRLYELPFFYMNILKNTWGTQMYIINRDSAKEILEKFSDISKIDNFSPDWTITKIDKSACIYPMLAVEKVYDKKQSDLKDPQRRFHIICEDMNYIPYLYI